MASYPTAFEQLTLELTNQARLDPLGEFERLIPSTSPLQGAEPSITNALEFFNVDLVVLKQQFDALVTVAPLAWNAQLGDSAQTHTDLMLAHDEQSHNLPGELDLLGRFNAAGYTGWSGIGENIFAYADSPLDAHAGFFIDWGFTATGIQQPPGHRDSIMSANFTEMGVGHAVDNSGATEVGPNLVTHHFGDRFAYTPQVTGVVFTDTDGNDFYSMGEGIGGATIGSGAGGASTSTWVEGGYNLTGAAGTMNLSFNVAGSVTAIAIAFGAENAKVDLYDGVFRSSVDAVLGANASGIELLGLAVNGTGNTADNTLVGNRENNTLLGGGGNDTLQGGLGNDRLDGGTGLDLALYEVASSSASILRNGATATVGIGAYTDTLVSIERIQFLDKIVSLIISASLDLTGDGTSDILWYNNATGQAYAWAMQGGSLNDSIDYGAYTAQWQPTAHGDFDGDGTSDIVWKDVVTGDFRLWDIESGTVGASSSLGVLGPAWDVTDTGDYNGDGSDDLLWRNSATGETYLWTMSGGTALGSSYLGAIGLNWEVAGGGDYDGDGTDDMVWRNNGNGDVYIWFFQNGVNTSSTNLGAVGTNWIIENSGDFNGNGTADIQWKNTDNGQFYLWTFAGGAQTGGTDLGVIGNDWSVAAAADYGGDGTDDILWRNAATGQAYIWELENAQFASGTDLGAVGSDWSVIA